MAQQWNGNMYAGLPGCNWWIFYGACSIQLLILNNKITPSLPSAGKETFYMHMIMVFCLINLHCHDEATIVFHQLQLSIEHNNWVQINAPPLCARELFIFELGLMWGAHFCNRSPPWSGLKHRFSPLRTKRSTINLSFSPWWPRGRIHNLVSLD